MVVLPAVLDYFPASDEMTEFDNKKKDIQSVKALAGQGVNHPDMRLARQQARGAAKARKDQWTIESKRAAKEANNIFLCPARCPQTFHYCRREYLTEKGLKDHIDDGKDHDFPLGISAKDKAVQIASKPGGLIAMGSRTNRKDKHFKAFPEAAIGAKGADAADCFQKFNRKEDTEVIHKTEAQLKALSDIFFGHEPKLTPAQARDSLRKMIDPVDGGLMFCYSKRGTYMPKTGKNKAAYEAWAGCVMCGKKPCECNGILLPEATIASYFSSLAASQKKQGKLTKKQAEKEATQAALVATLETA